MATGSCFLLSARAQVQSEGSSCEFMKHIMTVGEVFSYVSDFINVLCSYIILIITGPFESAVPADSLSPQCVDHNLIYELPDYSSWHCHSKIRTVAVF